MTLDTFFKTFDQFADAPDAVAKMRELVLCLAIQGGLVPNLSKEAAVPYKSLEEETPLNISKVPSNWRIVLLADAIKNRSGNSKLIKGTLFDSPASNRYQGFSASGADVWCESYEHEGDAIIISAVGARCGKAFKASGKWCAIANTNIARPDPSLLDFDFAYLVLNDENFWVRGGSAQPFVKFPPSLKRHFALPPLAEQKRIVAKVDELMALCDRLEAQQQQRDEQASALARASLARFAEAPAPTNLNLLFHKSYSISPTDLRKAILQLAFVGKLVSQDPKDEPASVLLEKARAEKARLIAQGIVKKEPWAHKLQDATNLYQLPTGWEWTHVSDVVEKVTVGFVGSMKEQYLKDGVPFLRCQNVRVNRYEPIGLTFVSEKFHQSISKSTLRPGDVVVTRSGNVGVTCVIPESLPEANCSDLVVVKRPMAILPVFLSYFINSIAAGQIEAKTVGVALTHFNTQSVAQMTVALPPLAEQRRIVAKVDQLMALVDQLETQLAASRATARNLLEALIAELTAA